MSETASIYIDWDELTPKGEEVLHVGIRDDLLEKIYEDYPDTCFEVIRRTLMTECLTAIAEYYPNKVNKLKKEKI